MASFPVRRYAVPATWLGIAALVAGAALVVLLAFLPATKGISVLTQTISEYGRSDGRGVFSAAVLLVAAGSVLILGPLLAQRRLASATTWFSAGWVVGLLVIVAVPKANWALVSGFNAGGTLHRAASVVAFVCLPIAVYGAAKTVFRDSPGRRTAARVLAVAALAWFAVIVGAVVVAAATGQRWWQLIPLGLVERGMALTGLVALVTLAVPTRVRAALPLPSHAPAVHSGQ
jgi:hypothetical protein